MKGVEKPEKPSPEYPLYAHRSGKWAKKIGATTRYFGRWDDPIGALREYEAFIDDTVSSNTDEYTVHDACNDFLDAKVQQREAGDLSPAMFHEYRRTCKDLIEHFGRYTPLSKLTTRGFLDLRASWMKRMNVVSLGNKVNQARIVLNWCHEAKHIPAPIDFGPDFRKPSRKLLRRHKREAGEKLFTADQIRLILDECGVHLKAMILLGINCAYGNTDCAKLPLKAIDLKTGWVKFPRPKTEVDRSCPLWPETVAALQASLEKRRTPKEGAVDRFFVTAEGGPWEASARPITKRFRVLRDWAGIKRGGFYWLRHTFQTIADETEKPIAVKHIMGHVDDSMSQNYRQKVDERNLRAVTEHVRTWLLICQSP